MQRPPRWNGPATSTAAGVPQWAAARQGWPLRRCTMALRPIGPNLAPPACRSTSRPCNRTGGRTQSNACVRPSVCVFVPLPPRRPSIVFCSLLPLVNKPSEAPPLNFIAFCPSCVPSVHRAFVSRFSTLASSHHLRSLPSSTDSVSLEASRPVPSPTRSVLFPDSTKAKAATTAPPKGETFHSDQQSPFVSTRPRLRISITTSLR